jgi:hypothetical protein
MSIKEAIEFARSIYWIQGDQYGFVSPQIAEKSSIRKAWAFGILKPFEREIREKFGVKSVQIRITSDPYDTAVHIHIYPVGTNDKLVFSVSTIANVIGYYFVDGWSGSILGRNYTSKKTGQFDQYSELVEKLANYILEKLPGYELLDSDIYHVKVYGNEEDVKSLQIEKQVIFHFFFTENTW